MNKQISQRIAALIEQGFSVEAAFDTVLGLGSFKALADSLYESFHGTK